MNRDVRPSDRSGPALALDFLNTLPASGPPRPEPPARDDLGSPDLLRAWLEAQGLGTAFREGRSPADERRLLDEARRLRGHVLRAVEAHCVGRRIPVPALHGLNRLLGEAPLVRTLEVAPEGPRMVERPGGTGPAAVLAPIAQSAAALLTTLAPSRIRRCASPACAAWFTDTSKGGQRKWCSMSRCGNRAKAATHRLRRAGVADRA